MERKQAWVYLPGDFFDALTFGELGIGDMFIRLPEPGDNRDDKGFKIDFPMYIKLRASDDTKLDGEGALSGVAKNNKNVPMVFPNSTPVVRLV